MSHSGQGLPPPNVSHGLPPTTLSQGLPIAQPPISAPSALHTSSQPPLFAPPPSSAGVGVSSYPPATGISRPPTMQGALLPGQPITGLLTSQPNHVTSPPPQPLMPGPLPRPPVTGLQGPPPVQPGYALQQNGML